MTRTPGGGQQAAGLGAAIGVLRSDLKALHDRIDQLQQTVLANEAGLFSQFEALMAIYNGLGVRAPLPTMQSFAIGPDAAKVIIDLILQRRPGTIVECGSGVSTVLTAYALERSGSGRIVSLDHLEQYADATRENLVLHGLEDRAEVRHAPLREIEINGRQWKWYDTTCVGDLESIDVLVVDGPPQDTQSVARYPALPIVWDRLAPDAVIVMDDARRPDEIKAVDMWLQEKPGLKPRMLETARGTALIER